MIGRTFSLQKDTRSGSALLIVLGTVVAMSALIVMMLVLARVERQSANLHLNKVVADQLAREGIENVRLAIEFATGGDNEWVSFPGGVTFSPTLFGDGDTKTVDLFSSLGSTDDAAVLNRRVFSENGNEVIDARSGEPFEAGWVYVRKDGTRDENPVPIYSSDNPVIGRYAYWSDDEGQRINVNTARTRIDNANPVNSPSMVELTAMEEMTTDAIETINAAVMDLPFGSFNDMYRIGGETAAILSRESFNTTFLSHSSLFTGWQTPRIFLTCLVENLPEQIRALPESERSKWYLDILRAGTTDPGLVANLDSGKVIAQARRIEELLSSQEIWGTRFEETFADRYSPAEIRAIAVNILEYVRSADSNRTVVEPMRFNVGSGYNISATQIVANDPNVIIGNSRRPLFSELSVQLISPDGTNGYLTEVKVEICIPKGYNLLQPGQSPSSLFNNIRIEGDIYFAFDDDPQNVGVGSFSILPPDPSITEHANSDGFADYVVVTVRPRVQTAPGKSMRNPDKIYARLRLAPGAQTASGFYRFWDLCPAPGVTIAQGTIYPSNKSIVERVIECPINEPGTSAISSVQVSDPRVHNWRTDWVFGQETFGRDNFNSPGNSQGGSDPSISPPQDTKTPTGNDLSAASLFHRSPRGTAKNPTGVSSVAELGFISTGAIGRVPWRSIRLQPGAPAGGTLPEWALMDAFIAPLASGGTLDSFPRDFALSGGINLNSLIQPYHTYARNTPLEALTKGMRDLTGDLVWSSDDESRLVAANIRENIPAKGEAYHGVSGRYFSGGELAEVRGIADAGEESERNLHGLVDLVNTRSNVFRVYSVGQAVTQLPDGRISVLAENYTVALLERIEGNDGRLKRVEQRLSRKIPF